jgi:plastocyanin
MHRRTTALPAACAALLLAAGCGSSGGSTGSTAATTSTSAAGTATSSLKVATTPKFASPSSSAPIQGGSVAIAYRNIAIDPDTIRVKVGSTITWTNYDSVEHNVTSEGGPQRFASQNFGEGKTFSVKVTKPGLLHYECTVHPTTMNGTIEVVR